MKSHLQPTQRLTSAVLRAACRICLDGQRHSRPETTLLASATARKGRVWPSAAPAHASREDFLRFMAQVPDHAPAEGDKVQ